MAHRHEKNGVKMNQEWMRFRCGRAFSHMRKGPILAVIPLQIAAMLLVSAKGAGTIYLDLLPLLIGITLITGFLVCLMQGNQKILLLTLILLTVGTMLQSIFKAELVLKNPDLYQNRSVTAGLQLQYLVGLGMAMVIGFLYWNIRECSSLKVAECLIVLSFLLSVITLIFAHSVGNVKNWIRIGGFSLQTTEMVKLFYVFIVAILLGTVEKADRKRIIAFFLVTFMDMGFLVLQSEFGTLLLILMTFLVILFMFVPDLKIFIGTIFVLGAGFFTAAVTGMKLKKLADAGSALANNGLIQTYLRNYQKIANRFIYWMHPEEDSLGQGYQLLKARESILLGGWFGTSSITDLPVKTSDLVFPALIQRCGMIFALLIFFIFILLWHEGMKICVKKEDKFHCIMAAGLISMFLNQTIIIIAGSTGLCPLTGITLPFISSGGSSLVVSFMLMSVLLCISGNISWKGINSEEKELFKKSTDGAKRLFAFGYRHVCGFVSNLSTSAGHLRGSRSEKRTGETEGI